MSTKRAYIDVYTSGGNFDRKFYEGICIRSVKEPELRNQFTLGFMIAMFEEQTLLELENDIQAYYNDEQRNNNSYRGYNSNRSYFGGDYYSALHQKLDELAARLNVNIRVFIGHIDICTDFLQKIEDRFPITEPTIILLIGCLGTHYAAEANQKAEWMGQPIAVMAFDNLLHVYDNKIYGCEVSHRSLPNMMCDYDGAEQDYNTLLRAYGNSGGNILDEYNAQQASYTHDNNLVKCCKSKLDRFGSVFLKNLRKRNCVEFTMENLEAKMRNLLKEDGTINRETLENPENYIFYLKDGVSCTEEEGCDINDPYEASIKNADEFNRRSSILNLYETFSKFIEDKKNDKDKEDFILKQLQALRPEEKALINYQQSGRTLLHMFAYYGYVRCLEYLLKKFEPLPLEIIDEESGNFFLEDLISNDYNSEEEKLRVLLKLHEKYPELLNKDFTDRFDVLAYATSLHYTSIVTFLAKETTIPFATKKYNLRGCKGANLLFVSCEAYYLTDEKSYDLVKILLGKGVDPNEEAMYENGKSANILNFYFNRNLPLINPKIVKALCQYGYNHVNTIDFFIKDFKDLLKGGQSLIDYKQYWINYYNSHERNNVNMPPEKARLDNKYFDLTDAIILNLPLAFKRIIKILEEAKKYIYKGRKTNKQINANTKKNYNRLTKNLNRVTRKLLAPEQISTKYSEIDEYIKKVGAKFTKEEKKKFREEGISVIQNRNGNALERLQKLENLLTTIQEQVAKRSEGGRRYRITRKKRV